MEARNRLGDLKKDSAVAALLKPNFNELDSSLAKAKKDNDTTRKQLDEAEEAAEEKSKLWNEFAKKLRKVRSQVRSTQLALQWTLPSGDGRDYWVLSEKAQPIKSALNKVEVRCLSDHSVASQITCVLFRLRTYFRVFSLLCDWAEQLT